ncbi:MAG: T9SS type A sorting domain-containing protein [Bacteroidetes bacterium]|nr:T9SS type A sorting domain-containing protein [Bacteroidota bacterium]
MYSMTGQLLMKRTIQSNKPVVISATDFSEGIYFLQVQTKQGNFNRKVVK